MELLFFPAVAGGQDTPLAFSALNLLSVRVVFFCNSHLMAYAIRTEEE